MFRDDFSEYLASKESGVDAVAAYKLAEKNGLDYFARLRMLRTVFNLTIEGAKAVSLGKTIESLNQDQEKLIPAVEIAMRHRNTDGT